jgi:DNA-binding NtrC family response regulator
VGHGTTFKIFLPAHEVEAESDMATSGEFAVLGTGTILLVDDEEYVRELGRKILARAGYTVISAADGREAIETYTSAKDEISLVILDLIMPIMDGHQCLKEILRIDPGAKVLILSGFADTGEARDATLTGSVGLVRKPFDLRILQKAVRNVLTEK